jgi:hypothetical protein
MDKHRFAVDDHVAIVGGGYAGHNGRIVELLRAGDAPVYAVKVLTGPYRDTPGSTVIHEPDLEAE